MSRPRCLRCGATSEWIEGKAPNEPAEGSFAAPTGLAACVAQWRDIQKRKRDFSLEAKHRGQDIAANIAMQVSNAYGYCADRLEHEMAANEKLTDAGTKTL